MAEIKRLPQTLTRNGIKYRMVSRTEKVILWELSLYRKCVGYEVSQIQIEPEKVKFGKVFPARETLPPNSIFGRYDKSQCFFSGEMERAYEYFIDLTSTLRGNKSSLILFASLEMAG